MQAYVLSHLRRNVFMSSSYLYVRIKLYKKIGKSSENYWFECTFIVQNFTSSFKTCRRIDSTEREWVRQEKNGKKWRKKNTRKKYSMNENKLSQLGLCTWLKIMSSWFYFTRIVESSKSIVSTSTNSHLVVVHWMLARPWYEVSRVALN